MIREEKGGQEGREETLNEKRRGNKKVEKKL